MELRPGAEGTQICSTSIAGKEGEVLPGVGSQSDKLVGWLTSSMRRFGDLSERLARPQREAGVDRGESDTLPQATAFQNLS